MRELPGTNGRGVHRCVLPPGTSGLAAPVLLFVGVLLAGCEGGHPAGLPSSESEPSPGRGSPLGSFRLPEPSATSGGGPLQFLISPTGLDFGKVEVGSTSPDQVVQVVNTGSSPVVMSGAGGAPGAPFSGFQSCQGVTLNPGAACQMTFRFSPTATGAATATSSGTWNGQPYSIELTGEGVGPQFLITPAGLDFGKVQVGTTSADQVVSVTNAGSSPVVMSGAGGAPGAPFIGFQSCQGTTLNPGESCQMTFRFSPTAPGPMTATSSGSWNGQPYSIELTGEGVAPQFLITPAGLDFGEVQVGATSADQVVSVTNAGASPVVMSGAGGAPGAPFIGFQSCQGVTLNPGESCQMTFRFSPTSTGPATATSSGSWNGQAYSITLTGTGLAPGGAGSRQFLITPTALAFGKVLTGATSADQVVDVMNVGTSPVVMSGAGGAPGGAFIAFQNCQGTTLNPGESCQMTFRFSPTSNGPATATSSGTWNGQAYSIELTGEGIGPELLITPTALDFGKITVGTTSADQMVTVTNAGTAPVVMSGAGGAPGGAFAGFQSCQGTTLNPGESCQMTFQFSPTAAGPATATSSGSWNGQPYSIELTGEGVGPEFLITPTGLDFGTVTVGTTSADQVVNVTNVGTSPVVMSGAGGAPGAPFNGFQSCQGVTLNPGESCQMTFQFSPTSSGPASATSSGSWNGQAYTIDLTGCGLGDTDGPESDLVTLLPNPAAVSSPVVLTATVDDVPRGGSDVVSAEYSIDGGPWMPMTPVDLAFDEPTEDVTAAFSAPAASGIYEVCVRGTDSAGNIGLPACTLFVVYDLSGGFATGGGWIDSPPGAFPDDPTLTGKATFGFVSKYRKGATVPDGSTEFQFRVAGMNFHGSRYEFLVISQGDSRAQFKGSGTINNMPAPTGAEFRFMIWATDSTPDTFRIKVWWEDASGENVVYDNGIDQPLGGGSIVVHKN